MSDRYIIIPEPAKFLDPHTKQPAMVLDQDGNPQPLPDRTFDWFLHTFMLTHLQFSMEIGGYDAVKAAKEIGKSLDKALDAGEKYFVVSADQHRRLMTCLTPPTQDNWDVPSGPNPNKHILAMSTQGMTRPMDNFVASCFMSHMDAIANASTNKPE